MKQYILLCWFDYFKRLTFWRNHGTIINITNRASDATRCRDSRYNNQRFGPHVCRELYGHPRCRFR